MSRLRRSYSASSDGAAEVLGIEGDLRDAAADGVEHGILALDVGSGVRDDVNGDLEALLSVPVDMSVIYQTERARAAHWSAGMGVVQPLMP